MKYIGIAQSSFSVTEENAKKANQMLKNIFIITAPDKLTDNFADNMRHFGWAIADGIIDYPKVTYDDL